VRLMQELDVDIAVDLGGHTLGQRTAILAQRPAPVQVNYLGLPATMGAPYIDYLIADRFLIAEERRPLYAEKVVWLEGCFQPNDDRRPQVPEAKPRGALGLPAEGLVLCSFNRNSKFNPPCFDVWMRLLAAVPGSVLWLLATHRAAADNLRRAAAARGVAAERLVFAEQAPYLEYLSRYRHVDLFLDTSPFNGGTTVSDAISMGVPVLTMAGESFSARMAGSILTNLGFAELVTPSLEAYQASALRLARDPVQLRGLRRELERRRGTHPFFDTDRYRANLEAAFQIMWERHAAGLPPAPFAAPHRPAPQAAAAEADNRNNGPTCGA
jgi:protein O-GlcNAc transferase